MHRKASIFTKNAIQKYESNKLQENTFKFKLSVNDVVLTVVESLWKLLKQNQLELSSDVHDQ